MTGDSERLTTGWLAEHLGGELSGSADVAIRAAAGIEDATEGDITFIDSAAKTALAEACGASVVIVPPEVESLGKPAIRVAEPRLAFARVLALFVPPPDVEVGVHPTAVVAADARLGAEVAVGAYAIVGAGSEIGDGAVLYPHVYVGRGARIGAGTVIWPHAVVGWGSQIGARCILHSGVVIGTDGFGYAWDGERQRKIPQIGRVVIEDDVEIGANTTIDRATMAETRIGRGSKIDDQVHIAHNVVTGEHCIIAGKVGISGSVRLGNRVILAGQVGIVDHVTVGDDAVVLARAAILHDLPGGGVYSGIPAWPHRDDLRAQAAGRKLPDLLRELRDLKARLAKLEEGSG